MAPVLRTVTRAVIGGASVMAGLYVGARTVTAYEVEWNVLAFSVVVVLGGTLLLARARHRPRESRFGGTVVAATGLLAGMAFPMQHTCCDVVWTVSLGFPLPWTSGYGDTWSQAVEQAWQGPWDALSAILDALFWAYAAILVMLVIDLLRRPGRTVEAAPGAQVTGR